MIPTIHFAIRLLPEFKRETGIKVGPGNFGIRSNNNLVYLVAVQSAIRIGLSLSPSVQNNEA